MKSFLLSLYVSATMFAVPITAALTHGVDSPAAAQEQPKPKAPAKAKKAPVKLPQRKAPEDKAALETLTREVPIIAQASPKPEADPVPPAPAPEPRIIARAAPEPEQPGPPVSIEIEGMTAYLVGERAVFRLLESGKVASRTWTILPAGTTGLRIYESGTTADFVARTPGAYVLLVAVAGKDGSVAQTFHSFELHSNLPVIEEEQPVEQPKRARATKQIGKAEGAQIVRDFTNEIESPTKARDMAQIRSALILVAGNLDTGLTVIPANANKASYAVAKIKAQAKAALNGNLGPWQKWFESLESFFTELDKSGGFKTPQNVSAAARSVAEVLDGK